MLSNNSNGWEFINTKNNATTERGDSNSGNHGKQKLGRLLGTAPSKMLYTGGLYMSNGRQFDAKNEFSVPKTATQFKSPFSQEFIDKLRSDAESQPWPQNTLHQIEAEILQADRDAHIAMTNHDQASLDSAIMRRVSWGGILDKARNLITNEFLSMASIAMESNPEVVCRVQNSNRYYHDRFEELERQIALLQTRLDHAEAALTEVAGVLS
ncbi:MAG: hypothetical protein U0798_17510 [Gemmataceae bacterium]